MKKILNKVIIFPIALLIIIVFSAAVYAAVSSLVVNRVDTTAKVVALTFDDCSNMDNTRAIADVLASKGVKATFFVLGEYLDSDPALFKSMSDAGNQIANHTYDHANITYLTADQLRSEVSMTDAKVLAITGKSTQPYFRPPGGYYTAANLQTLGDAGYTWTVKWNINTYDYNGVTADEINQRVFSLVIPGSIVLMHCNTEAVNTAAALPQMIDELRKQGYQFVTVDELLKPTCKVTFDRQDGTAATYTIAGIGSTITAPVDPTRTGYRFAGWYKDAQCTTGFNFAVDTVTADTTLYAKWISKLNVIAGTDRYATAVEISKAGWQTSDTVILATGTDFPDALAAGPLAYQQGAPVLLTYSTSLPQSTADELARLKAKKAIIMGGEAAVSSAVVSTLNGLGISVERVSGSDRFGTAVEAAAKVRESSAVNDKIVLAYGWNFPDALSAGSYAAKEGIPILLTDTSTLTAETKAAISSFGIKEVLVVGSTTVISQAVESELKGMGITVTRIYGSNRFGTAAQIAGTYFAGSTTAFAAYGWNFPDALAAVPLAAKLNAPVLLVEQSSVPSETAAYLGTSQVTLIDVVGGDPAVGSGARDGLSNLIK